MPMMRPGGRSPFFWDSRSIPLFHNISSPQSSYNHREAPPHLPPSLTCSSRLGDIMASGSRGRSHSRNRSSRSSATLEIPASVCLNSASASASASATAMSATPLWSPSLPPSPSPMYSSPIYTNTPSALSCSTIDLDLDLDLDLDNSMTLLSPRTLYAQSFARPDSARSLPGHFRKNVKQMAGQPFGTTEQEFEALPLAVRRKYFSTLERLRFAQNSRSNALNDLPIQSHRKSSLADRRGVSVALLEPRRNPSSPRRLGRLARQQSVTSDEASWFLTLPDKIKKKQFTREEQVVLAARLRESVILDAADEAIYKASRRATRNLGPLDFSPYADSLPSSSLGDDMDSPPGSSMEEKPTSTISAAIYDSFRWMDEESDLDLKLALDDYHANLDGVVIPAPGSNRRPSFRRQMSISKIPFGRNSVSAVPLRSPTFPQPTSPQNNHARSRSRTKSLIAPKHVPRPSVASIDPNAAHYQDPEARLKLRVYLASPQKFDEAIEFGFPSMDRVANGDADKENKVPVLRSSKDSNSRLKQSGSTDRGQSFLNYDTASLFEDDASIADPESPITPMCNDLGFRPTHQGSNSSGAKSSNDFSHLGITKPTLVKQNDTYAQAMAGSREMTLRMTLTRPDLRADEGAIYGWQQHTKASSAASSPLRDTPESFTDIDEKYEVKGPLGGADGWGPDEKETGVVKRFWHRVKSSQRKSSG